MPISLTEDFKTIAELKKDLSQVLEQVHRTGRPVVVTRGGKPDLVILDAATYEERLKTAHFGRLLAEAHADVRAGNTRPAEEFFEELDQGDKKVSRSSRARGRA
jgi:prevent-host-death family protein